MAAGRLFGICLRADQSSLSWRMKQETKAGESDEREYVSFAHKCNYFKSDCLYLDLSFNTSNYPAMKKSLLLCCVLGMINTLLAQNWPVGTTWVYDQIDFGPFDPYNYVILQITKDTVIQNEDAKELFKFHWNSTWDSSHAPIYTDCYYIKTDKGRVSLWDEDSLQYHLIYDFTANVGDTVSYYVGPYLNGNMEPDFVSYRIDSIASVQTSGGPKKKFYFHKTGGRDCFNYLYNIVEDIGAGFYFFQTFCAVDPPEGGGLSCFTNGQFTYPPNSNCKIPTGLQQVTAEKPKVYPNPSSGNVYIQGLDEEDYAVELWDQFGRQYSLVKVNSKQLDIHAVPAGVYLLKLINQNKTISLKIIKV